MRTVNEPTYLDILHVSSWLCKDDRQELALTRDPDDYVALARDAWDSVYRRVILEDSQPVMAYGAKQIRDNTAIVWGFKTERGRFAGKTMTKDIRRSMIPALRGLGIRRAACLVHPDNYRSQRWLRSLGFTPRSTLRDLGPLHENGLLFQRDEPDA